MIPFVGTRSFRTLERWIDSTCGGMEVWVVNVSEQLGRPRKEEIRRGADVLAAAVKLLRFDKIVALGTVAREACEIAGIPHFKAPHPSGLNRALNDKQKSYHTLVCMREYLKI